MTALEMRREFEGEFAADARVAREELTVLLAQLGVQAHVALEVLLADDYAAQTEEYDRGAALKRLTAANAAQAEARRALDGVARHLGVRL